MKVGIFLWQVLLKFDKDSSFFTYIFPDILLAKNKFAHTEIQIRWLYRQFDDENNRLKDPDFVSLLEGAAEFGGVKNELNSTLYFF